MKFHSLDSLTNYSIYFTVTLHYVNSSWELRSVVLQTRQLSESHTAENLADVLKSCFSEWGIYPSQIIGVTDNAKNIINAWSNHLQRPNIPCVAHTLNLAVGKVLKVGSVANVLGHVRNLASQFHYSTTLAAKLKAKQALLKVPQNKLFTDCPTRWNSSYDMLVRILEQQLAVCAVVVEAPSKVSLSLEAKQIKMIEELCEILKPMKDLTVKLSSQTDCTSSIILPSLHKLMSTHLAEGANESKFARDCKAALKTDLNKRYQDQDIRQHLLAASILDPRFRQLSFASMEEKTKLHDFIIKEAVRLQGLTHVESAENVAQVKSETDVVQQHPGQSSVVAVKTEVEDDPDLPSEQTIKKLKLEELILVMSFVVALKCWLRAHHLIKLKLN